MADISFLLSDLAEARQGNVSEAEEQLLNEAHELFHRRSSGPLPWSSQVVLSVVARHIGTQARPTVSKQGAHK